MRILQEDVVKSKAFPPMKAYSNPQKPNYIRKSGLTALKTAVVYHGFYICIFARARHVCLTSTFLFEPFNYMFLTIYFLTIMAVAAYNKLHSIDNMGDAKKLKQENIRLKDHIQA